jgi:hypothetical protein
MGLIKRFVQGAVGQVEGKSAGQEPIPASPPASAPQVQESVPSATNEGAASVAGPVAGGGMLKRLQENGTRQKVGHRATLDFLNILKSLAPVFKAATIYPGHDAPAEQIAVAVRRLSEASVSLAEFIAANGDSLEVDSAWARKTLHEFTAELVSSFWVSSVIAKGGSGGMPEVTADFFKPAITAVMSLPGEMPKDRDRLNLTTNGAVQLSLLKALAPIAIEIERFGNFITTHAPGSTVSAENLISEISQFLMEQALMYHDRFVSDNPEASEDDRRVMLQSLIGHSASVILSAWEYCKGEVYSGVSEAQSSQAVLDFMSQAQFTHGFPLQLLKTRTEESLRRLVGSATYALSMMQRQGEEPRA